MTLDHGKLGLENKSGRIFWIRQVYFTKSCQQIWGRVNQPIILFIHHIWGETVLWGTVFIIQTSDRMQYFTIFQYKLHSFNTQDDRSTRGLLAKPLKKFPKSPIGRRFSLLQCELWSSVWMNIIRVTLQHNKELIMFILLMVLSMCNLQKGLKRGAFWVLLQAMFTNDCKQTVPRLKLQERLLTINKGNIIRWSIYRDNNFHSRRQN